MAQSAIITRGGNPAMKSHEQAAVRDTEAAQNIIYAQLAPAEKENVRVLPAADTAPSKSIGGLHDAKGYLQKALSDCSEADSDKAVAGDRGRETILIKSALAEVDAAIAADAATASSNPGAPGGQHPAYLHGLEDLKMAQAAILARGGDAAMKTHEQAAMRDTEAAQNIIYAQLAPAEKENVRVLPAADTTPSKTLGGLHDAKGYLQKALSDCSEADSDKAVAGDRGREVVLIKSAMAEVDGAISDFAQHR